MSQKHEDIKQENIFEKNELKKDNEKIIKEEPKKVFWYTKTSKCLRGLLCMLAFAVFMACFSLVVFGEAENGMAPFMNTNSIKYEDSAGMKADLKNETSLLLDYIYYEQIEMPTFWIWDVSQSKLNQYPLREQVQAPPSYELFERNFQPSETKEAPKMPADLDGMSNLMGKLIDAHTYLYFDKNAFKKLFVSHGIKNENYRFSKDFSEEAYFLICGYDDSNEAIDLDLYRYAVYDPVQDIYYSTQDEYFEPYENYIYDCSDVYDVLKNTRDEKGYYASFVFALLDSTNFSIDEIIQTEYSVYDRKNDAKHYFQDTKNSSFVYYVKTPDVTYSNVKSLEAINGMECIYQAIPKIQNGDTIFSLEKVGNEREEEAIYDAQLLSVYDAKDLTIYVGADFSRVQKNGFLQADGLATKKINYELCSNYGIYAVMIGLLAFVVILILAVSLICSTGRTSKRNPELDSSLQVRLIWYDKLPTELWILINMLLFIMSAMLVLAGFDFSSADDNMLWVMLIVVVTSLPFAFFFMELTLSFARRIKARNLISRIGCLSACKWLGEKSKPFTRKLFHRMNEKSASGRLWSLFKIYLIFTAICVLAMCFFSRSILSFFGFVGIIVINSRAILVVRGVCHDMKNITECLAKIKEGDLDCKCDIKTKNSFFDEIGDGVNHIGDGIQNAVAISLKDERMKTELITNVSHDLKTPLTSIINYVDLLKKQEMPTEEAKHYLEVLDTKSQRLKHLTEDLVEAAKANSGNIELECMPLAFDELMRQAIGEFEDKFSARKLQMIASYPDCSTMILADGRRIFRVIENVLQNAYKYALEGTRVYADLVNDHGVVMFSLKNVSAAPLNISADELMERFTRGDSSRTTEGSGLGLSIAKDLTGLMNGEFAILLDGDLFKVVISFPQYKGEEQ